MTPEEPKGFIPKYGWYEELLTYRKAEVIYLLTFCFCDRFIDPRDRTRDQLIQAARSGKQNIVEGSLASATSKEMELKLTNVARASLGEVLQDYRDFLRTRKLVTWDKNSKQALYVRRLGRSADESYETYREYCETRPAEVVANVAICLIHQAMYLLDRQIKSLEKAFLASGGLREAMTRARLASRKRRDRES